jgi:hypothetical protein
MERLFPECQDARICVAVRQLATRGPVPRAQDAALLTWSIEGAESVTLVQLQQTSGAQPPRTLYLVARGGGGAPRAVHMLHNAFCFADGPAGALTTVYPNVVLQCALLPRQPPLLVAEDCTVLHTLLHTQPLADRIARLYDLLHPRPGVSSSALRAPTGNAATLHVFPPPAVRADALAAAPDWEPVALPVGDAATPAQARIIYKRYVRRTGVPLSSSTPMPPDLCAALGMPSGSSLPMVSGSRA